MSISSQYFITRGVHRSLLGEGCTHICISSQYLITRGVHKSLLEEGWIHISISSQYLITRGVHRSLLEEGWIHISISSQYLITKGDGFSNFLSIIGHKMKALSSLYEVDEIFIFVIIFINWWFNVENHLKYGLYYKISSVFFQKKFGESTFGSF